MKIGIITYHNVINYGAVLQALALQKVLYDKGNDTKIINYTPDDVFLPYKPLSLKRFFKCLKKSVFLAVRNTASDIKNIGYQKKKNKLFAEFCDKYLHLSGTSFKSIKDFKDDCFDVCFTGSDQVWNPDITQGFDPMYFLKFGKDSMIRASYAASVGRDKFSDTESEQLKTLLSDFDYISVREKSVCSMMEGIIGYSPQNVLDPTLLIDKKGWEDVLSLEKTNKKYIFVYTLYPNSELDKFVEKLSNEKNLPVITITKRKLYTKQTEALPYTNPKKFAELVANAEYVVTNSFHGTAFSVNFSRNFYTFTGTSRNSRILDLLDTLGISERAVSKYSEDLLNISDINYDDVQKKLFEERNKSLEYINMVLESAKKND